MKDSEFWVVLEREEKTAGEIFKLVVNHFLVIKNVEKCSVYM